MKTVEKSPVPLAVLISGRGSNLGAILEAVEARRLRAWIAVVISNRADAAGLARAQAAGIATRVLPHQDYATRDDYDRALIAEIRAHGAALVCLAGFMRRLGPAFCDAFPSAILNIHPSLLPAFPGTHAPRQALDHGVKVSGATVHFVTPDLDAGPIVLQTAVPVRDDDTEESLAARILAVEHELYPAAIQRVIDSGWRIDGRRVIFNNPA